MARPRKVQDADMIRLVVDQKLSRSEIAAQTGLTVSGVDQMIRSLRERGLLPPVQALSHAEAMPWTVTSEHSLSVIARYMRNLSSIGQGKALPKYQANTAFRWAQKLIEQKLDVDYDRDQPSSDFCVQGGFFTKPADPDNWHLKEVLDRAKAGALKKKL